MLFVRNAKKIKIVPYTISFSTQGEIEKNEGGNPNIFFHTGIWRYPDVLFKSDFLSTLKVCWSMRPEQPVDDYNNVHVIKNQYIDQLENKSLT